MPSTYTVFVVRLFQGETSTTDLWTVHNYRPYAATQADGWKRLYPQATVTITQEGWTILEVTSPSETSERADLARARGFKVYAFDEQNYAGTSRYWVSDLDEDQLEDVLSWGTL